jgi:cytochrome c biogenesis protein CcdA
MKKPIIIGALAALLVLALVALKYLPGMSGVIWSVSQGGTWLLPLVVFSSLLDSVHPCSFSILLITIAFLFGMNLTRGRILAVGGVYIAGIFASYLLIGLGLLKVLHLFNTPHFMGIVGAGLLVLLGLVNLAGELLPAFPVRLAIPHSAHRRMATLMERGSIPTAFVLGGLVGICEFPCSGGPYLMVLGLLNDQATFYTGVGYLFLYNAIFVLPLAIILVFASDVALLGKVQQWQQHRRRAMRLGGGAAMVALGLLIFAM